MNPVSLNELPIPYSVVRHCIKRRAKAYAWAYSVNGYPMEIQELVSRGHEIAAEAIGTYDPKYGASFHTYLWHRLGRLKDTVATVQREFLATRSRETLLETTLVLGMDKIHEDEGLFLDDLGEDARQLVEYLLDRGIQRGIRPTARAISLRMRWTTERAEDAWEEAHCWIKSGGKPYIRRELQCAC